jgi:hypothetical protein
VIGLTSPANVEFVKSLGCYSRVVTYDDLSSVDASIATVYADFAGNATLRSKIHTQFAESLKYSCSIGGTHWEDLGGARDLPGPKPTLFFAPHQAKKRLTEWGGTAFQMKLSEAWERFIAQVSRENSPWMTVVSSSGNDAISAAVTQVIQGEVNPVQAHVLRFG